MAHVQRTGDVAGKIGDWVGTRGSRQWIEGFSLAPRDGVKPTDIEYQAVLGRGWLSPWIEGGKFCGSRGMALPLAGPQGPPEGRNVAKTHECSYSATFVDGSSVGPIPAGETCEAESLAALEAFQIVIAAAARKVRPKPHRGEPPGREPRSRQPRTSRRTSPHLQDPPRERPSRRRRRGDRVRDRSAARLQPPARVAA